jgi:exonuclease-1
MWVFIQIFFKMSVEGDGMLFDETKLYVAMGLKSGETFRFERFRWMCILSGCDYLASLPGIGLGRAKKLVDSTSSDDIRKVKCSNKA